MSTEPSATAVLTFHEAAFRPGASVIKAHEREKWVELEQLRAEADRRVQQEALAATQALHEELQRRGDELLVQRLELLADAFAAAALDMERTVLDLALQVAEKLVEESDPAAFFARAALHLQALVPVGSAVRVRVHPNAVASLGALSERLRASGVQHISVVTDPALTDLRSLVVETREGEIDLGWGTQWRRLVAAVKAGGQEPRA